MMKYLNLSKFFLLIIVLSGFVNGRNIEDRFNLKFFYDQDFPIKIDGGCSYFTFDTISLSKGKYIMVVDGKKLAFVKNGEEFKFLTHTKRTIKPTGYVDYYGDSGYKVVLDVNKGKRLSKYSAEFAGTLKISSESRHKVMRVHGINEEHVMNN
jgi:hypothetical protein